MTVNVAEIWGFLESGVQWRMSKVDLEDFGPMGVGQCAGWGGLKDRFTQGVVRFTDVHRSFVSGA